MLYLVIAMKSHFTSTFFKNNRQRFRQQFKGTAPVVITANGLLQRGADSTYAFSQDANFWYLTGVDEPDVLLVMDRDEEYLIVPKRSGVRETFDGAVSFKDLTMRSGIKTVYDDEAGWQHLAARVGKVRHIATVAPPPDYVEQYGFYTNPARRHLEGKLKEIKLEIDIIDVGQTLARLRMIKQTPEIVAIQAAIDITIKSLRNSTKLNMLSKYEFEYQLEAEIKAGFRKNGAVGEAFESIVAAGKNACILHNINNDGKIGRTDLVLTDIGAEVEHYAADITRVFCVGKPSARQKAVHQAVLEVQQFAIDQLKPGALLKEYEQTVEDFMGQKLRQLKLIKTVNHENVRQFYPHATSHFLGLNVHDVGDYSQPLQAGAVITVEPGIYIATEGIGVRIEDDILITKTGNQILSAQLSRNL